VTKPQVRRGGIATGLERTAGVGLRVVLDSRVTAPPICPPQPGGLRIFARLDRSPRRLVKALLRMRSIAARRFSSYWNRFHPQCSFTSVAWLVMDQQGIFADDHSVVQRRECLALVYAQPVNKALVLRTALESGTLQLFCLITGNFTMPLYNRIWRDKSFCNNGNNSTPTTFWARHALLLVKTRFLHPRNGRAEIAICPGEWPLPCPRPRTVRAQSVAMSNPRPQACSRLFRVIS